ncbi:hypothetical protein B0T11DRAFT_94861 [Plectosphaerella cucumerina]|uniref:Uncharacterized protein n=1 Tax=Plectosphaerella cucumerina TaxID=40658 RepID=A0A8K0TNW2_9PEZI|nr:hypothetical protein B0T11DRAFT_94861 [Plectosphaerella cucumerina]
MEGILLLTDDDKRVLESIGSLPEGNRSRVCNALKLMLSGLDIATLSEDLKKWPDTWSNVSAEPFSLCFKYEKDLTESEIIIRRIGLVRLFRSSKAVEKYGRLTTMCKRLRHLNYVFRDNRLKDCLSEGAAYHFLVPGDDMTLLAHLPSTITPTQYSKSMPKQLEALGEILSLACYEKVPLLKEFTTHVFAALEQQILERPQFEFMNNTDQPKRQATSVQFEPPAKRHRNHIDGRSRSSAPLAQGTTHSGRIHCDNAAAATADGMYADPKGVSQAPNPSSTATLSYRPPQGYITDGTEEFPDFERTAGIQEANNISLMQEVSKVGWHQDDRSPEGATQVAAFSEATLPAFEPDDLFASFWGNGQPDESVMQFDYIDMERLS